MITHPPSGRAVFGLGTKSLSLPIDFSKFRHSLMPSGQHNLPLGLWIPWLLPLPGTPDKKSPRPAGQQNSRLALGHSPAQLGSHRDSPAQPKSGRRACSSRPGRSWPWRASGFRRGPSERVRVPDEGSRRHHAEGAGHERRGREGLRRSRN